MANGIEGNGLSGKSNIRGSSNLAYSNTNGHERFGLSNDRSKAVHGDYNHQQSVYNNSRYDNNANTGYHYKDRSLAGWASVPNSYRVENTYRNQHQQSNENRNHHRESHYTKPYDGLQASNVVPGNKPISNGHLPNTQQGSVHSQQRPKNRFPSNGLEQQKASDFLDLQKYNQPEGMVPQLKRNNEPLYEIQIDTAIHSQPLYHNLPPLSNAPTEPSTTDGLSVDPVEEDGSEVDHPINKRTVGGAADVRAGVIGFLLLIVAACFLIVPVVITEDPWNAMKGYMIAGFVIFAVALILIIGNIIWCNYIERMVTEILLAKRSGSTKYQVVKRPQSQNTTSTDLQSTSEINNNVKAVLQQDVSVVKTQTLSAGVSVPHTVEPRRSTYNDYQDVLLKNSKYKVGYNNDGYANENSRVAYDNAEHMAPASAGTSANTLDTAFVHTLRPSKMENVETKTTAIDSKKSKKHKKSRRKNPVEYPRTSTRKNLTEQGDTDSAPENLNATALRQKLMRDPRFTSGYLQNPRPSSSGNVVEAPRYQENIHNSAQNRHSQKTTVGHPTQRMTVHSEYPVPFPPKQTGGNDRQRSKSENGARPSVTKTPTNGLLEIARQSYSQYIHGIADDMKTTHPSMRGGSKMQNDVPQPHRSAPTYHDIAETNVINRQYNSATANTHRDSHFSQTYAKGGNMKQHEQWREDIMHPSHQTNTGIAKQKQPVDNNTLYQNNVTTGKNVYLSRSNDELNSKTTAAVNAHPQVSTGKNHPNPTINNATQDSRSWDGYLDRADENFYRNSGNQNQGYNQGRGMRLKSASIDSTLQTYI